MNCARCRSTDIVTPTEMPPLCEGCLTAFLKENRCAVCEKDKPGPLSSLGAPGPQWLCSDCMLTAIGTAFNAVVLDETPKTLQNEKSE